MLFEVGGLRILTQPVCLLLAVMVMAWVSAREAGRLGLPLNRFYDLIFFMTLAGLAGAYLFFVALNLRFYLSQPWRLFDLFSAGLGFFGGLAGALAVAYFYPRRHGFSWRQSMDALALGLPLGLAISRLGCFAAGCCYGRPTDLPWAVRFPLAGGSLGQPLHPTQLYEAGANLLIFAFLFAWRRRPRFDGGLMLLYLFLASGARFLIEFYRSPLDYRGPVVWHLPLTQIIALTVALVSGGLWCWSRILFRQGQSELGKAS